MSSVRYSIVLGVVAPPSIRRISASAASAAMRSSGWRMVVRSTMSQPVASMPSKPVTQMSAGADSPTERPRWFSNRLGQGLISLRFVLRAGL